MGKLVRDRIPEIITANGDTPQTRILSTAEFKVKLKEKLVEEAQEVGEAVERETLIEELADVEEVLAALRAIHTIDAAEVEAYAEKKRKERGGFSKMILLEGVIDNHEK